MKRNDCNDVHKIFFVVAIIYNRHHRYRPEIVGAIGDGNRPRGCRRGGDGKALDVDGTAPFWSCFGLGS